MMKVEIRRILYLSVANETGGTFVRKIFNHRSFIKININQTALFSDTFMPSNRHDKLLLLKNCWAAKRYGLINNSNVKQIESTMNPWLSSTSSCFVRSNRPSARLPRISKQTDVAVLIWSSLITVSLHTSSFVPLIIHTFRGKTNALYPPRTFFTVYT